MDPLAAIVVATGVALMLGALADAAVTVLHPDSEGPAARLVQTGVWRLLRGRGRRAQAAAGPTMLLCTFLSWLLAFIVGYALVVWPFLGASFRSEPEIVPLDFTDALYHSGITVTVLGYGDLTALSWPMQFMAVAASAGGFVLLTAIATYMIQLVGGISPRVRFALHAGDETHGSYDGVQLVLDRLAADSVAALDGELQRWATMVRDADEGLHRQPLVGLFYRSADPVRDPEPAMAVSLELSIAAQVLAEDTRYAHLRSRARSLGSAVDRLIDSVSVQHLSRHVRAALAAPPDDAARRTTEGVVARFEASAAVQVSGEGDPDRGPVIRAVYRRRVFLEAMHELTRWEHHLDPRALALTDPQRR